MIKFKVWWKPQVPCKSFEVEVKSRREGLKICEVLANYDLFQFENNIKGDYANAGGVVFRTDPVTDPDDPDDWCECPENDDDWEDYLTEIQSFILKKKMTPTLK